MREDAGLPCLLCTVCLSGQGGNRTARTREETGSCPDSQRPSSRLVVAWRPLWAPSTQCLSSIQIRSQQPWELDSCTPAQCLSEGHDIMVARTLNDRSSHAGPGSCRAEAGASMYSEDPLCRHSCSNTLLLPGDLSPRESGDIGCRGQCPTLQISSPFLPAGPAWVLWAMEG